MSTLLVDNEEDCMCFSTQSMPSALATPALEMLDFSTSVSGALKVHPTLYNLVESTDEELLSIINSFQAEGVHLSCHFLLVHSDRMFLNKEEAASNTAEENEEVLNDALRGLRNPSFPDNFERFFWTAQETHDFFDTADLSDPLIEQDAERSMQWDKFALFFDGMNSPDYVCNFSSMIDSANIRQVCIIYVAPHKKCSTLLSPSNKYFHCSLMNTITTPRIERNSSPTEWLVCCPHRPDDYPSMCCLLGILFGLE